MQNHCFWIAVLVLKIVLIIASWIWVLISMIKEHYSFFLSQEEFKEKLIGRVLDEENGETYEEFPWKTTEDEMLLLKEKVQWFCHKNVDARIIAVVILKFEQCGCTTELCVQRKPMEWHTV